MYILLELYNKLKRYVTRTAFKTRLVLTRLCSFSGSTPAIRYRISGMFYGILTIIYNFYRSKP
jgi:hypothetical protein